MIFPSLPLSRISSCYGFIDFAQVSGFPVEVASARTREAMGKEETLVCSPHLREMRGSCSILEYPMCRLATLAFSCLRIIQTVPNISMDVPPKEALLIHMWLC